MANIQLAENLRYLRELNNQSQTNAGDLFSVSRQAISNYENLTRMPDLEILVRIADYYNLTLDQLILHNLANPDSTIKITIPHNLAIRESDKHSIFLSDEEVELIMDFRALSTGDRALIKGFTKSKG